MIRLRRRHCRHCNGLRHLCLLLFLLCVKNNVSGLLVAQKASRLRIDVREGWWEKRSALTAAVAATTSASSSSTVLLLCVVGSQLSAHDFKSI